MIGEEGTAECEDRPGLVHVARSTEGNLFLSAIYVRLAQFPHSLGIAISRLWTDDDSLGTCGLVFKVKA